MSETRTRLVELLRNCVQCGLCLPHCATYLASGNEVLSPRGRLILLNEVLAGSEQAPESYLAAFDQCIGCRACESVCPSGVSYDLLAHGQHLAARRRDTAAGQRPVPAVPEPVLRRLDSVDFLRLVGGAGATARSLCRTTLGDGWRRRLAGGPKPVAQLSRLLGSLPTSPQRDADLVKLIDRLLAGAGTGTAPAARAAARAAEPIADRRPLQFFAGCANAGLLAGSSRRLVAVLTAAGFEVQFPADQDCCGALAAHTGRPGRAADLQRRNRGAFALADTAGAVPIVVEAAGCTLELQSYGREFAERVVDAVTLLAEAVRPALRPVPLKVALHDPCHARHGLGVVTAPRQLLSAIPGLTWCEATEQEVCCGSGGAWGLRYPEMSADLARRKAADLAATGADLVVTANPGCLGQIADGLALEAPGVPILPLTDLWWYAARLDKK